MRARGAKPLDVAALRELCTDPGAISCGIGRVYKPDGQQQHWAIQDNDVLIEVRLMPEGQPLTCRMGGALGGPGFGMWRIPPEGTEVAILFPGGTIEGDPLIVAVLASQAPPDGLDDEILLVVDPKKVRVVSTGEDVEIEASGSGKKVLLQGGGKGVARLDDTVAAGELMAAWMAAVETTINSVVPSAVTTLSTTFAGLAAAGGLGKIATASSKTETG